MDPISALSLASAIVQFLDFALDTLALCREIRDDATGATETNKRLEQHTKHIKSLQQNIRHGSSGGKQGSRRINKIANDCTATSNEMLQVLDKVRLAKNGPTAKATFRLLKERRTIEKLQNILKERQALLDSALVQDVRHRLDLATLTRSEQFEQLQDGVKDLVTKLEHQSISPTQQSTTDFLCTAKSSTALGMAGVGNVYQHITLGGVGNKIQLGNHYSIGGLSNDARGGIATSQHFANRTRELEDTLQESHKKTHDQLSLVRSDLSKQRLDSRLADRRTMLLNSLFYAEQASRQSTIKPPHQRTFDWVFDEPRKGKWSSFPDWLQSSRSLYWISGKPGSGKSTLLAHIVNDSRTRSLLQKWTSTTCALDSLHVLKFFFWRSGSPLQRSIEGLLRSLLFQLIEQLPEVGPCILAKHAFEHGRIPQWTESMLTDAVCIALNSASKQRSFGIFIDGLDEFVGDTKALLDFIVTVSAIPNVKICVSSRWEAPFVHKLSQFPYLRMEHLNYDDIKEFVNSQLLNHQTSSVLAWLIYIRSDGVFLWAVLVTRSTLQGIENGDDDRTLEKRIEQVPREVSKLIKQIFESLDAVYTDSLGTFLGLMRPYHLGGIIRKLPSLALFTAARMDSNIITYEDFLEQCMRTKQQIGAQSCGLLQVSDPPACKINTAWQSASTLRREQDSSHTKPTGARQSQILDRIHGPVDDTIIALIRCEMSSVSWLHRSVCEMVYGDDVDSTWNSSSIMSLAEATELLIDGQIRLLATAPSLIRDQICNKEDFDFLAYCNQPCIGARIANVIQLVENSQQSISDSVSALDNLKFAAGLFSQQEFTQTMSGMGSKTNMEFSLLEAEIPGESFASAYIYSKCTEFGLTEYPLLNIDNITQSDDSGWILSRIIYQCCALGFNRYRPEGSPEHADEIDHYTTAENNRKILLLDLLKALLAKLYESEVAQHAPLGKCTDYWRIWSMSTLDVSWDCKGGPSQRIIERETVCAVAVAYYRCTKLGDLSVPDQDRGIPEHPDALKGLIIQQFKLVLAHWNVYIGLAANSPTMKGLFDHFSGTLCLQRSASVGHISCQPCNRANCSCVDSTPTEKPRCRIVCKWTGTTSLRLDSTNDLASPWRESVIVFDVSPALGTFFASIMSFGIRAELDEDLKVCKWKEESGFFDALIKDVWKDEEGQLTAWQQLFVLACIRKETRENLKRQKRREEWEKRREEWEKR